jgi:hypothetical protein
MAIEDVTAKLSFQKMTFPTVDDLWDLWSTKLFPAGWVGGVMNARGLDGQAGDCFCQATSPSGQQLVVTNSTVVTLINDVYAAMTEDEYQARYGTNGEGA